MKYDLLFDTETTGLWVNTLRSLNKQPKVTEYFGLAFDRDTHETLWEYETLVKVGEKLDPKIVKITTITDEMLETAPWFEEVADKIQETIENAERVVAHNLFFDVTMIDFEFNRLGRKINWPELVCTVESTEWINGYRLSLSNLHEFFFGEKFEGAHRAGVDVRALAKCYSELLKRGWI